MEAHGWDFQEGIRKLGVSVVMASALTEYGT